MGLSTFPRGQAHEAAANLATPWFDDPPPPPDPPQTDTDDTKGERAGKVTPPKKN